MAFREFRFHRGGGTVEYDTEPVAGITYEDPRTSGALHKTTSPSITRLIRNGEWCHHCDLELPEPVRSPTIQILVLRAIREGRMNLTGLHTDVILGRLKDQRCPACGALMTDKMIELQMMPDVPIQPFDPGDVEIPKKPFKRRNGSG